MNHCCCDWVSQTLQSQPLSILVPCISQGVHEGGWGVERHLWNHRQVAKGQLVHWCHGLDTMVTTPIFRIVLLKMTGHLWDQPWLEQCIRWYPISGSFSGGGGAINEVYCPFWTNSIRIPPFFVRTQLSLVEENLKEREVCQTHPKPSHGQPLLSTIHYC